MDREIGESRGGREASEGGRRTGAGGDMAKKESRDSE